METETTGAPANTSGTSSLSESNEKLEQLYLNFVNFGKSKKAESDGQMDGVKFAKLCKDCKLVDKEFTPTDVDLVFAKSKAKTDRKISYDQFISALQLIAQKKYSSMPESEAYKALVDAILAVEGPKSSGTSAQADGVYSKLTNTSNFTGVYKNKTYGESTTSGSTPRPATTTASKSSTTPKPATKSTTAPRPASSVKTSSAPKATTEGSIFDRLTDSKLYTGSHKNRFNEDGSGKGKEGRDIGGKGGGTGFQSKDLSGMVTRK